MISRRKASTKNALAAMSSQIVKLLGQFVVQTVFIRTLGATYLGANGLFTNLITFLSFAELGIGLAFNYELYKPLADSDEALISAVMGMFRKVYNVIGIVILISGLVLSYFVPYLTKGDNGIDHLRIYFVLFLLSSVVSYFFTYNRSLLIADQLGYIDSRNQLFFSLFKYCFQILFLVSINSYTGFLLVQIATNLLSNIWITRLAQKKYPFLDVHTKKRPSKKIQTRLKKNVIGTISSKVGSIVVNGTDNVLISKFIGLSTVGLYSNYSMIVAGLTTVLGQVLNSVIASFGNLGVAEADNREKQINLFNKFIYFNAFFVFFVGLSMYGIFQPFVHIWLGNKYQLSNFTLMIIVVNFVLAQFRPALFLINAYGLFWGYRYKSIVEAAVNFALSLCLVMNTSLGISGVLLGTIIGNVIVNSWWDPLILFSGAYKMGISKYYSKFVLYILFFLALLAIENKIINIYNFVPTGIVSFLWYAVIVSGCVIGCLLVGFVGCSGQKDAIRMVKKILRRR